MRGLRAAGLHPFTRFAGCRASPLHPGFAGCGASPLHPFTRGLRASPLHPFTRGLRASPLHPFTRGLRASPLHPFTRHLRAAGLHPFTRGVAGCGASPGGYGLRGFTASPGVCGLRGFTRKGPFYVELCALECCVCWLPAAQYRKTPFARLGSSEAVFQLSSVVSLPEACCAIIEAECATWPVTGSLCAAWEVTAWSPQTSLLFPMSHGRLPPWLPSRQRRPRRLSEPKYVKCTESGNYKAVVKALSRAVTSGMLPKGWVFVEGFPSLPLPGIFGPSLLIRDPFFPAPDAQKSSPSFPLPTPISHKSGPSFPIPESESHALLSVDKAL